MLEDAVSVRELDLGAVTGGLVTGPGDGAAEGMLLVRTAVDSVVVAGAGGETVGSARMLVGLVGHAG